MATNRSDPLCEAFREDHAVLGRGFHELSTLLRGRDTEGARIVAERVDSEAGAHIAFEEEHFYPTLARLQGAEAVEPLYAEHAVGLEVVRSLCEAKPGAPWSAAACMELLGKSEIMERHIADCGTLFGAMASLAEPERARLLNALNALRRERPRWSRYAQGKAAKGARAERP